METRISSYWIGNTEIIKIFFTFAIFNKLLFILSNFSIHSHVWDKFAFKNISRLNDNCISHQVSW